MREYRGSLAGRPWVGWAPDHEDELDVFRRWVGRQVETGERIAVDSESKGLRILSGDPNYIRLCQYGNKDESWVLPVERGGAFREVARWALEILPKTSGHNYANFDALAFSAYFGLDYDLLVRRSVDTLHLAKLIDPRAKYEGGMGAKLKELSDKFVDPDASDTQDGLTSVFRSLGETKSTGWAAIDLYHPIYQEYAALDTILVARLEPLLTAELDRLGVSQKLRDYENEIARICGHMSLTGMALDREYTEALSERLRSEAAEHSAVAATYGVANTNATRQVIDALSGMGETFTEFSEKTGQPKVDKAVLHALADIDYDGNRINARNPNPLALAIIRARRAGKWNSSYAENFLAEADVNGRIHPSINTLAARTGRMSVRNPAVQTLPSGDAMIRRALLADVGHRIVSCDFDGVEMRVLASLANVKRMKDLFINGDGKIHEYTAELVYGKGYTKAQRKIAKSIGFGRVYGGGAATVARQTGAPMEDVQRAMVAYGRAYPELTRASAAWQREARVTGMTTVSVTGRRLPLDRQRTYAVTNYQVQSAARDVLGQSLINMDNAGLTPYLRLAVHDEVIASVPEREAPGLAREIERCMNWSLFDVPITASAEIGGRSWGSLYGADY